MKVNNYFIFFIIITVSIIYLSNSSQDEASLLKLFTENKEILCKIIYMQKEDYQVIRISPSFTRLYNDWSWPRDDIGITTERWNEYKKLFSKSHIDDGIQKDGDYIWFFVSSSGLSISGSTKGFMYNEKQQIETVNNFNKCIFTKKNRVCFINIEENWYLFKWRN